MMFVSACVEVRLLNLNTHLHLCSSARVTDDDMILLSCKWIYSGSNLHLVFKPAPTPDIPGL